MRSLISATVPMIYLRYIFELNEEISTSLCLTYRHQGVSYSLIRCVNPIYQCNYTFSSIIHRLCLTKL